ncbi:probable transmembrane ascorbate ferrireductase 3 [Macadamia integrifolia]|uniref:probable transmembrane ascorbate ferrireductase 3 n=1 Tax=Macadamia integrifolia TaxID=60698 RepID=UPI001C4F65BD|nr:probable transmembrane ascorbate ferrireductase 3 [Macadamia integrifolia]
MASMGYRDTVFGHIFGITALILLLAWLLHFHGGIDLDSNEAAHMFNVHPFLMYFGFIFFAGEAMMAYKTVYTEWKVNKLAYISLHIIAIVLGIVGIYAAFKYHDKQRITNMYSLHSWLGIGTFCLYGLQWIIGFLTRTTYAPWHISFSRVLLYMAICTAESGLMQSSTLLGLKTGTELFLVNFTGLFILLFGIAVDFSIASIPMVDLSIASFFFFCRPTPNPLFGSAF